MLIELGQVCRHEVSLYDHSVHMHYKFQIIACTTYSPEHDICHIHLVLIQEVHS